MDITLSASISDSKKMISDFQHTDQLKIHYNIQANNNFE